MTNQISAPALSARSPPVEENFCEGVVVPPRIHVLGELHTPPDRLVLFGRERMLIPSPSFQYESENQRVADAFIETQNVRLLRDNPVRTDLYTSMLRMEAGIELRKLCLMRDALKIQIGTTTYFAGTYEGNSALIDLLGRRSVELASGVITCASSSSAPNTYFRCVEFHAIRDNKNIVGVRVLDNSSSAVETSRSDESRVESLAIYPVTTWAFEQKDQWWRAALSEIESLDARATGEAKGIAQARFLGELFHIVCELKYLSENPNVAKHPLELHREVDRAMKGLMVLNRYPEIVEPLLSAQTSLALAKMFVYKLPADSEERRHVLGLSTPKACASFVSDSIKETVSALEMITFKFRTTAIPPGRT
jgi:hypothetical protein